MYYNLVQVEAIKLAVWNTESRSRYSKEILEESIAWLLEAHQRSNDCFYLEKAFNHIYAYLELGYPYEEIRGKIAYVTENLAVDNEELEVLEEKRYPRIKLSKTNIRNLMGRWNPVLQSMTITEVVDDIYEKAIKKQKGVYLYHCGKNIGGQDEECLWQHTYKLYINGKDVLFQDVNKYKYYQLV